MLACTSSAAAQQEAETPQASDARLAFEQGLELLRDQRWVEAEAAFRQSLAAMPRASAQYDLALVVFKQGRLRESIELLQQLVNSDAAKPDPVYRNAAATLLSEALSGLAVLHLTVTPATAEVRVDGEVVAVDGRDPSVPLDPGDHDIEVAAPGFQPARIHVAVAARGEERRTIVLQASSLPEPERNHQPAPAAALAAAPTHSWLARYGPWFTIGIGGALLASALAVGALAKHADADFSEQCPTHHDCDPSLKPKRDRIARLGTVSDVLLASGAVVVAGGIGWELLVDTSTHADSHRVAVSLAASGRF
jgi:tetratricopeptide (TPR) repeat protein